MNYIKGKYRNAIYENDSGYKIGLFKVKETNDLSMEDFVNKTITFTGYFVDLNTEDNYIFYGKLIKHDRYGLQYVVSSYEKEIPTGVNAVIEFLSSSLIKGCGEKTAKRIVDHLGEDAINIIKKDYKVLLELPNITENRAIGIYESLIKYSNVDDIIIKLKEYELSIKEITNIINVYNIKTLDVLNTNIYLFKEFVNFKKLDKIFLTYGSPNDSIRVKACIIELMNALVFSNGDTYHYLEEIAKELRSKYGVMIEEDEFLAIINDLIKDGYIIYDDDKYYLSEYYQMEDSISESLKEINSQELSLYNHIEDYISEFEKNNKIIFNDYQKEAIVSSLINNVSIITGGPGTGKTTIVKAIVRNYIDINKLNDKEILESIVLLAPTGRASKRLSEVTNLPAKTIHRYLKWNKEDNSFQINEMNKSEEKLIIVDETSMIDTFLLDALLKGINYNIKIIFIGDENQLPSVGGGLVLNDIINSNLFNHVHLTDIYRQANESYIPYLCQDIKNKNITEDMFIKRSDYSFIEVNNKQIRSAIEESCHKALEHGINEKQLIVLAPMYKGENGIDNLNIMLQKLFNPSDEEKQEFNYADVIFREDDKVIQLVNDVDNNVFNGDIGYIKEINTNSKDVIKVNYDGNIVCYQRDCLLNIKHAYAISIHKSQGSEFDHVLVPISCVYSKMLYNKIIYTATSRAKKSLTLIGEKKAFKDAILNDYSIKRKTTLCNKLLDIKK